MKRDNNKYVKYIDIFKEIKNLGYENEWKASYNSSVNANIIRCIEEERRKKFENYYKVENKIIETKNRNVSMSNSELEDFYKFMSSLDLQDYSFVKLKDNMVLDASKKESSNILLTNAIVVSKQMDSDFIETAPSKISMVEFINTYYSLDLVTSKIVKYLNNLGFLSYSRPSMSGELNYPLVAQESGLGYIGKSGILISPISGPRQRISVILTNINNFYDNKKREDFSWIEGFCSLCKKCINHCPTGAIYGKNKFENNFIKYIDYKKCLISFSKNFACGVCIKVCPFNNVDYYKIKKSYEDKYKKE